MTSKPTSARRVSAERRNNPRSGRRSTDNREELELRLNRIVEYLHQQNPEFAIEDVAEIRRTKARKP
jgi:hypothetical protein